MPAPFDVDVSRRSTAQPSGPSRTDAGTRFTLHSPVATAVELCLIDGDPSRDPESTVQRRIPMFRSSADRDVWEAVLNVLPGQRYGFRVHGPWDPRAGHRCNPAKLLCDPYARSIEIPADPAFSASDVLVDHAGSDRWAPDHRDSLLVAPWSVVVDPPQVTRSTRPRTPMARTVIYEVHVAHATSRHPSIPEELRGTYAALGHPAFIDHLHDLGVTAVELLPVQQSVSEPHLVQRGLRNAWGYNTVGFFAPHAAYCAATDPTAQLREVADAVAALHEADIEVILDVVYNHTAEGPIGGPTYNFRGIDNAGYYRLDPDNCEEYVDVTGCGNTFDTHHPAAAKLVLDSLRYWAETFDVDGYRFDLATSLGRTGSDFDPAADLLVAIDADPVVGPLKLIAEPWDVGPGGYQLGSFATPASTRQHDAELRIWSEWNDRYRDDVRDFWRGHGGGVRSIVRAIAGSSEIFLPTGRPPQSSINFITAHDGFTLRDLVSYDSKHNEANGENNRDGSDNNHSWNSGHEGETDDHVIRALRLRRQASMLCTLYLSLGTPMLNAGDEQHRTQGGNNNTYCQTDPAFALPWSQSPESEVLLALLQRLALVRSEHGLLTAETFYTGRRPAGSGETAAPDVQWLTESGEVITEEQWEDTGRAVIGVLLTGGPSARGPESRLLLWLNGNGHSTQVALPESAGATEWTVLVDTGNLEHVVSRPRPHVSSSASITVAEYGFIAMTG